MIIKIIGLFMFISSILSFYFASISSVELAISLEIGGLVIGVIGVTFLAFGDNIQEKIQPVEVWDR